MHLHLRFILDSRLCVLQLGLNISSLESGKMNNKHSFISINKDNIDYNRLHLDELYFLV